MPRDCRPWGAGTVLESNSGAGAGAGIPLPAPTDDILTHRIQTKDSTVSLKSKKLAYYAKSNIKVFSNEEKRK